MDCYVHRQPIGPVTKKTLILFLKKEKHLRLFSKGLEVNKTNFDSFSKNIVIKMLF